LGWSGGIGLGPGSVFFFEVSGSILPGVNLGRLIYLIKKNSSPLNISKLKNSSSLRTLLVKIVAHFKIVSEYRHDLFSYKE